MREPGSEITEDLALIVRNAIKYIVSLEHDASVLKKSCASLEEQNTELDKKLADLEQTSLELCETCGWRTLIPGDVCLNCTRSDPDELTVAYMMGAQARMRKLTDEVIAELWYKNGTHHHHFARAIERWIRGTDKD